MNYVIITLTLIGSRRSSWFGETSTTSFISATQVDNSFVDYTRENTNKQNTSDIGEDSQQFNNIEILVKAKSLLSKNIIVELNSSTDKSKELDSIIDEITLISTTIQNEKNNYYTTAQSHLAKYEECKSQKSSIDTQFYQELNNGDIAKSKTLLTQSAMQAECMGVNRVNYNGLSQIINLFDAYSTALQNKKTVLQTYYNTIITQTNSLDQSTIDKLQTTVNDLNATTLSIDS